MENLSDWISDLKSPWISPFWFFGVAKREMCYFCVSCIISLFVFFPPLLPECCSPRFPSFTEHAQKSLNCPPVAFMTNFGNTFGLAGKKIRPRNRGVLSSTLNIHKAVLFFLFFFKEFLWISSDLPLNCKHAASVKPIKSCSTYASWGDGPQIAVKWLIFISFIYFLFPPSCF